MPPTHETFVYKIFCPESKQIKFLDTGKIEKCLAPGLREVSFFTHGMEFATVEVHFSSVEGVRRPSDKTLKTAEAVLLPSYMGQHTSCIRIEVVPPEAEVAWVMAALCQGIDDKITILQFTRILSQNRNGQTIEVLVQAALDILENMPNHLFFDGGHALKVVSEGCKPRCFWCGLKRHVRASCNPKRPNEEAEAEKKDPQQRKLPTPKQTANPPTVSKIPSP